MKGEIARIEKEKRRRKSFRLRISKKTRKGEIKK